MSTTEQLSALLARPVEAAGLALYDVTFGGDVLRVLVTAEGGVDLDHIGALTGEISRLLDEHDPISGRYTLEVSSPGLERTLRTPEHFAGAVGETVQLKTTPEADLPRRLRGTLRAADEHDATLLVDGEEVLVPLHAVAKARTVFEWGPTPKPSAKQEKKAAS
jgi:ribosome maturation factor RimP